MAGFRLAPRAARLRRSPWQRRRIVRGVTSANLNRTVDDGFTIIELDFAYGSPYVSNRTYQKTVSDGFTIADSVGGAGSSTGTATGGLIFLFSQGTTGSAYTRTASDGFTILEFDSSYGSPYAVVTPVGLNSYSRSCSDGFTLSDAASGSTVAAGASSTLVGVDLEFTALLDVELVFAGE